MVSPDKHGGMVSPDKHGGMVSPDKHGGMVFPDKLSHHIAMPPSERMTSPVI
jgi:hypothetical protein